MDIFPLLKGMPSVMKVSNLYDCVANETITFLFFICPKMKGNGFRLNGNKTGLEVEYVGKKFPNSAIQAIGRAMIFLTEFQRLNLPFTARAIYASADALMLPSVPTSPPEVPTHPDIEVVPNDLVVASNICTFGQLYRAKPWSSAPQRVCSFERDRLSSILSSHIPANVAADFVERTWSGFALDGLLIRQGLFGFNPVLLGVESPGISILQNAALPRDQWLPVLQLA